MALMIERKMSRKWIKQIIGICGIAGFWRWWTPRRRADYSRRSTGRSGRRRGSVGTLSCRKRTSPVSKWVTWSDQQLPGLPLNRIRFHAPVEGAGSWGSRQRAPSSLRSPWNRRWNGFCSRRRRRGGIHARTSAPLKLDTKMTTKWHQNDTWMTPQVNILIRPIN